MGELTHQVEGWAGGKFVVYGLIDPRTNECRYIGKSSSGLRRPRRHGNPKIVATDTNRHKANWILEMQRSGVVYGIRILEECADNDALKEAEIRWIAYAKTQEWPLVNLTSGGDGLCNASAETRAKIGAYSRARMAQPEYIERAIGARRGKKLPREWVEKSAAAMRGRKRSPETIEKVAAANRGKKRGPLTPEWREKVGAGQRGKPKSVEHRAKIGAASKGKPKSLESIAKMKATKAAKRQKKEEV
jgi:hypothetical protein